MVPTSSLFQLCEQHDIDVTYDDLGSNLRGLYVKHPRLRRPLIALHSALRTDERLLRCVLAEEIGHHLTGAGNYMIGYNQNTRVWMDKAEYMAMKWAVDYLVPEDRFVLRVGRYRIHELADIFYVTEDFVRWQVNRLRYVLYEKWKRDPKEWDTCNGVS